MGIFIYSFAWTSRTYRFQVIKRGMCCIANPPFSTGYLPVEHLPALAEEALLLFLLCCILF